MSPLKSMKIIENNNKNIFEICLNQFKELTNHSELFLNVQNKKAEEIKVLLKSLYDFIKSSSDNKNGVSNSLSELIIDDMDEEQIWQQLELHNEEIDEKVVTEISKLSVVKRDQIDWNLHLISGDNDVQVEENYDADETLDNEEMDDELDSTDEIDSSEDEVDENDYKDDYDDDDDDDDDDDEDGEDDDIVKSNKKINEEKIKEKFKPTVVDDKFFKLREMEKFLDAEDEKEMKKIKGDGEEANSDEEEIDYFADSSDDDEDDEVEDEDYDEEDFERKNDKNSKFADFFDDEEEENNKFMGENHGEIDFNENESDNEEQEEKNVSFKNNRYMRGSYVDYEEEEKKRLELRAEKLRQANEELKKKKLELGIEDNDSEDSNEEEKNKTKVRFNLDKNSYLSDNDSNEDEEQPRSKKGTKKKSSEDDESKSTFEKRQDRLKHRIENLEEAALNEKPWQLKGEIKASSRPRNSLLEEILEFDATTRPAPIITEDTTLRLEDIIKQRIKDKAFDSVVKKYKPINTPQEYRKKLVLDQEKSKESLSQIYEKEYLKQLDATNPGSAEKDEEEPKEHKEIREMMTILMSKLNALSNFHFTPKPAIPEAKIMTNLPAINIEEVAPVSVSDAAMLAPEEIRKPVKGDVMGKDERTRTDKNRQRRQKKLKQKSIKYYEEKKEKDLAEKGLELNKKDSNKKLLDKVTKSRNVEKMTVSDGKSLKSSKAFFSQLQDEVTKQVKSKTTDGLKRKQKATEVTAKKLKL